MMVEGFLSHQEGVLDTGEKLVVVAGDRGVRMVKTGGEGLGDELVLTQYSVGKLDHPKPSSPSPLYPRHPPDG